jgi:hypothetical protein
MSKDSCLTEDYFRVSPGDNVFLAAINL